MCFIGEGDNCEDTSPMCLEIFVLKQDDLDSFRLKARSDVIGTWEIESTTYNHFYCQVKIIVSGCSFNSAISRSGKTYFGLQMKEEDSIATKHTRVLRLFN